jgi:hypothetical protein
MMIAAQTRTGRHEENEGERRREQPRDEQGQEAERQQNVTPPIRRAPAGQQHHRGQIQDRYQMDHVRGGQIPLRNLKQLGERRKCNVDKELRGNGGREPGQSDGARQKNDADREFGAIHDERGNALGLVTERQSERQCSGIEPGKIRKIHRAHAGQHAVRAEIEWPTEVQNGLDVPPCPVTVDPAIKLVWRATHADDHHDGQNAPRQYVRQGSEGRFHQ